MAEEYHLLNEINKIKRWPCSASNGEYHELSHVNVAWTGEANGAPNRHGQRAWPFCRDRVTTRNSD
jgi:hypothetical protein